MMTGERLRFTLKREDGVRGVTAGLLWRAVYLAKMPGLSQRAGILADWPSEG